MIPYLRAIDPFPPVESARRDMGGLLAVGADLSPDRILLAYRQGIFPWGTVDGYPLWYSPDPRMVLFPDEFRLTRSLAKILRGGRFEVRFDSNFAGVIDGCAATPRPGQVDRRRARQRRLAHPALAGEEHEPWHVLQEPHGKLPLADRGVSRSAAGQQLGDLGGLGDPT